MFVQMWRTSNILFCILLLEAFTSSLTILKNKETSMTTNNVISTNQHTPDPVPSSDSSQPESTIVTNKVETSIKAKPKPRSTIGVATRRQSKGKAPEVPKKQRQSTVKTRVVTQKQSSDDDDDDFDSVPDKQGGSTKGWLLDFIGSVRTSDEIITTSMGDMYSDKDVYDHGMKTGEVQEQNKDINKSQIDDTSQEIVYFLCVLVGCFVFTTGALSAKSHLKNHPQNSVRRSRSPDHRMHEEEFDYNRTEEEAMDEYQLKAHWLSELGNKM